MSNSVTDPDCEFIGLWIRSVIIEIFVPDPDTSPDPQL